MEGRRNKERRTERKKEFRGKGGKKKRKKKSCAGFKTSQVSSAGHPVV